MTRFQKFAVAALVSLLVLVFVGATVRVTGAGLGCPDWPRCWGGYVPPSDVSEIDFSKLPMEKFRRAAEKLGEDPEKVTVESLREEFNPRHAWTEYINRLTAMPVSIFTLLTFIAAFWQREKRPAVFWMAFASVLLVVGNALVGALVVSTRLKPVVITTHLALAMLMLGTLTYCAWRGTDRPWRIRLKGGAKGLKAAVIVLLVVTVAEGITGSQIREVTDELAKLHVHQPRTEWIGELEATGIYFFHRSFSWAVLAAALWAWWMSRQQREGGTGKVEIGVLAIVFAQMVLGIVMARIHIYAWVQLLHVGLASVLLVLVCLWWFGMTGKTERGRVG